MGGSRHKPAPEAGAGTEAVPADAHALTTCPRCHVYAIAQTYLEAHNRRCQQPLSAHLRPASGQHNPCLGDRVLKNSTDRRVTTQSPLQLENVVIAPPRQVAGEMVDQLLQLWLTVLDGHRGTFEPPGNPGRASRSDPAQQQAS